MLFFRRGMAVRVLMDCQLIERCGERVSYSSRIEIFSLGLLTPIRIEALPFCRQYLRIYALPEIFVVVTPADGALTSTLYSRCWGHSQKLIQFFVIGRTTYPNRRPISY